MGAGLATLDFLGAFAGADEVKAPELGFLEGLGDFISEDKGSAPVFLLQADYSRTVNIAVAGNSGVGKSLLVNTVRGVKAGDDTWAPVGVTETTHEPKWYTFPGETSVRLWDMEGAGGTCSWDNYTGSVGLRFFDVVLLLSSARLTDSDVNIMQELEKQSIPYFFVRTKLDEDIKNNSADYDMSEEETEEGIRCDLQLKGITSPYLVNARHIDRHDFPRLIRDVVIRLEIFERKSQTNGTNGGKPQETAAAKKEAARPAATAPAPAVAPAAPAAPAKAAAAAPAAPAAAAGQGPAKAAAAAAGEGGEAAAARAAEAPVVPAGNAKASAPPLSKTMRPPPLWKIPKGKSLSPIEALVADGGRWTWLEDEGFMECLQAEMGVMQSFLLRRFNNSPEHTWTLRPDGVWECKLRNGWTSFASSIKGRDSEQLTFTPLPEEPEDENFTSVCGRKVHGKTYSYIESGRLVSEQGGKVLRTEGDGNPDRILHRLHRCVVDDVYWLVMENVLEGRYGIRRFRRYPFYRIVNETGEQVTMKTYSVAAIFSAPNMTVTVDPGTSILDCYAGNVTVEQVVFSLPNRTQYTISQAEPFETYCLRIELFS